MSTLDTDASRTSLRRTVYVLLCVTSLAAICGRIMNVSSAERKTPFLSANDRSRWCTIRALVDLETYSIDELHQIRGWGTIDKVYNKQKLRYYSSKPTLFPTMLAGQYWVIKQITGATLEERPFYIARLMLVLTNVLPLALYFFLLACVVEKWGKTDWGRIFTMAAAAYGTFLTTYGVTLNNHLPAAISVMAALYAANAIWFDGRRSLWLFVLAGFGAGFAAANELPALSFLVFLGTALLWKAPVATLTCFLPAVILVAAGFFGTNYLAHDSWKPPYMHRDQDNPDDNWYDYPDSYWTQNKEKGIDAGEPSRRVYAMNAIIGHHGILSLTPVWLLSIVGLAMLTFGTNRRPSFALFVIALTVICLTFYLMRPLEDRNYGGVTCGFRWMFWFTPMWLLSMLPAVDALSRNRWLRGIGVVLLLASTFSANYASLNPWSHPWIYQYWQYIEWL